jgi:acetolactate synthase-1/2/3 large subunit
MAVTGNVPTSQFNRGAFQEMYRHYQADFPSTVRTMCKKVFQPTRGEMVPLAVRQAWKTMVTGRPGPVVLDVPFDVFMEASAEEAPNAIAWNANISSRCGADPDGVVKAVDMLLSAEQPVILVGQGVRLSPAPAIIRPTTPRGRPTCCSRSASASMTAPRARGSLAIPSPFRRRN